MTPYALAPYADLVMGTLAEFGPLAIDGCGESVFGFAIEPFHLQLTTGEALLVSCKAVIEDAVVAYLAGALFRLVESHIRTECLDWSTLLLIL